jgi:hypothetical protein
MCEPISATAAAAALASTAGATAAAGAGTAAVAGTAAAATGLFGTSLSAGTALSLAGTALTTGMSMMGRAAGAASTQALYIQNAWLQNKALAQNYNGISLRQSQESDRAQSSSFDILRGLAVAKGKATAAAGEAGVGGVSFANVLSDYEMRDGLATGNVDYNYTASIQNAQNEKDAAKSRTEAGIASLPQANPLSLYAGIGADAITGGLKIYDIADKGGLFGKKALVDGADKPTGST